MISVGEDDGYDGGRVVTKQWSSQSGKVGWQEDEEWWRMRSGVEWDTGRGVRG